MAEGALSGLKVLDLSQYVAGPYCTKLMADLGAEVIKIEEPGVGDSARTLPPFFEDTPHPERSGLFLYLNTNKLGITLKLDTEAGREIFIKLARSVDIIVHDNPDSILEQCRLGYQLLSSLNRRLILTSISPFGSSGPYKDYKGCDLIATATGGFAHVSPLNAREGEPPLKAGGHVADLFTGLLAAAATLTAVHQRHATGAGQEIDVSAQEAILYILMYSIMYYNAERHVVSRTDLPRMAPRHLIPCKDGEIWLQIIRPGKTGEEEWDAFCRFVGAPELSEIEVFRSELSRAELWESLEPLITKYTREITKEEFRRSSSELGLTIAPLNSVEEVVNSSHLADRDFFVEAEHPETGKIKYPGAPYKFSKTPWMIKRPAPRLGEHNGDIYCQRLGYTEEDLVHWRADGII